MEYDSFLINLKDKLANANVSELTSFVNDSEAEFGNIDCALTNVDNVSSFWKDAVEKTLASSLESAKESFASCKDFATNVVSPLSGSISSLITELDNYVKLVDKYNNVLKEYNNIVVGNEPKKEDYPVEYAYVMAHSFWQSKKNNKERLRTDLITRTQEINEVATSCYDKINTINGLLGGVDTLAAPTLEFGGLKLDSFEETLDDGSTIKRNQWCDEDGNVVREDYTITSKSGEVVETGTIENTDSGKIKRYTKNPKTNPQNIVEEYDKSDKIKTRKIDRVVNNGVTQTNIVETYDENGKAKTKTTEKIEYPNFTQTNIVETYEGDKLVESRISSVKHKDGKEEKNIYNNYNDDITEIGEIKEPDGTVKKNVHIDSKENFKRYESIEYPDGKKEIDVYEQYETPEEGGGEDYLKSRNITTIEYPDGSVKEAVYEKYDEHGNQTDYSVGDSFEVEEVEDIDELFEDELSSLPESTDVTADNKTEIVTKDGEEYTVTKESNGYLVKDSDGNVVEAGASGEDIVNNYARSDKNDSQNNTTNPTDTSSQTPNISEEEYADKLFNLAPNDTMTVYDEKGKYTVTKYDSGNYVVKDENGKIVESASTSDIVEKYNANPKPAPEPTSTPAPEPTSTPAPKDAETQIPESTSTQETENKTAEERFGARQRQKIVLSTPPVEIKATPIDKPSQKQRLMEERLDPTPKVGSGTETPATSNVGQTPTTTQNQEQTKDTSQKQETSSQSSKTSKANQVFDDLNSHYAIVKDMPYRNDTERAKAMLTYIGQKYGTSVYDSYRIYNIWQQNSK